MNDLLNHISFRTLLGREIHRCFRLANQTIIPPLVTATLYIVIFGKSIGSRINDIQDYSYMQFLIPGLIMMNVISSSYGNTSSSLFSMRFQGFIQELLVSPMSAFEVVLALILGGVLRGVIVGGLVTAISMCLADVPVMHIGATLYFVAVVAVIFSCAGFLSAIWSEDFERLSLFQTYLLTPLTYLGGVFFAVEMLPPFWQKVAMVNPVLYFVNGLRYGFLGISDVSVVTAGAVALGVALGLFGLCVHLYRIGYNIKV